MCFPGGVKEVKIHLGSSCSPSDIPDFSPSEEGAPSSPNKKALPSLHSNGLSKAAVSGTLDFPQSESMCWALPFEFVLMGLSHVFVPVKNVRTHKPIHPSKRKHFNVANFGYLQDRVPLPLPITRGI